MTMQFRQYPPHPLLRNFVERIWVFSSSAPIPGKDMRLIVPTGRIKLIIPFRDVATSGFSGATRQSGQHSITLIGLTDIPLTVSSEANDPSGTVGIEFTPGGAYRFFRLNYREIKNHQFPLTDILGKEATQLARRISEIPAGEDRVRLLQEFLVRRLTGTDEDAIFDFCCAKIRSSKGRITVKDLEKLSGYTSRWLNMKFLERVGTSPKNLSAIVRFREVYQGLTGGLAGPPDPRLFYDFYYDQSHFIRDFKRFTGMPPHVLEKQVNDFGRLYFRG